MQLHPKSDWLETSYNPETYFSDIESSPTNKFTEICDITSGGEDGIRVGMPKAKMVPKPKYNHLHPCKSEVGNFYI